MKIIAAILAKLGSKRLPNKLLRIINGKTAIEHLFERACAAKEIQQVVLATADKSENKKLALIAKKYGVQTYFGSEVDTLDRLYRAGKEFGADALLRLTGDNILIDHGLINSLVREYRKQAGKVVLATTCLPPTFPEGFSMEIVSMKTLEDLQNNLKDYNERAAFMVYVSAYPKKFPRYNLSYKKDVSQMRLTMDYPEDLNLIRAVFNHFKKNQKVRFNIDGIISFLESNPKLLKLNENFQDRTKYPFAFGLEAIKKAM